MEKKARLEYLLSEAGRKKSLLAGGDGKELQVLEVEVTPEIVNLGRVDSDGNILLEIGFSTYPSDRARGIFSPGKIDIEKTPIKEYWESGWKWGYKEAVHRFDEPQTMESLLAWEQARLERLQNAETNPENLNLIAQFESEHQARVAEEEKKKLERETDRARIEAERAAREEEEKALRAEREREKKQWISLYGSDYLKRAVALGYDCQRQYVTERAAREFPDYEVDFDCRAEWRSRSCPSEEALDEVEDALERGFSAQVVWLTYPPYELEYNDAYEPCEAIVVQDYLGKYDLVKVL
ncbi:MAG: hypothetical protein HPY70_14930 [Firmicutes bacterium]|nr:hypothetical protein [Bacillota bacterium]